jgi:small lipoprotein (TIGR04454 family)
MRSFCLLLALLALLTLTVGCGHPATETECQEIVERIATLELEKAGGATDAKSVAEQIDATKKALSANTLKDCVGKRITERAMQCVRTAKTSSQIVDDCFR